MPDTSEVYERRVFSGGWWWWDGGGPMGHPVYPAVGGQEG